MSAGDQSYSVRAPERGRTSGSLSKHAYAYQGLARLLISEGLGGRAVSGESPLGSASLRLMLEPQLLGWGQQQRRAFREFLTSSTVPVLLVPNMRASTGNKLRLERNGFVRSALPKPLDGKTLNAELGFEQGIMRASGLVQGRLLGFDVGIDQMLSFADLPDGAEIWTIDGQVVLYRQRVGQTDVFFLSDADLLNNAGLAVAENAAATLALIAELRDGRRGPVVFDNRDIRIGTAGAYGLIWRLFEFPLAMVSGSVLALSLLLFWLSFGRFGPIMREARGLDAGKSTALDAAVSMLAGRGNNREVLRRYLDGQTRQLALRLGGPRTGDLDRLRAWLDAVAERRRVDDRLRLAPVATLLHQDDRVLSEGQAARAAHTIHAFRSALIHDS